MNGINSVAFLVLRRLRAPLILLVVVYSVNMLGYVLIPGVDSNGDPYRMTFFDAFYFVSFMGSTIGFGEIPHDFTNAQRLWTMGAIYTTVISWLYSIGSVIAIMRDEAFIRLVDRTRFRYWVKAIKEPFYLVCGYGLTGSVVVQRLVNRGVHCVVIDISPERIEGLDLDNLAFDVPCLCADASEPDALEDGGIQHPFCVGVLCLTNVDHVNLSIAIASKLLVPHRTVISRTETEEYARNLASFGTDHAVYPFEIFADYLNTAIHNPYRHLVHDWLVSPSHRPVSSAGKPKFGTWVICGYGRFGKALKKHFDEHDDVNTVIIEPNPELYREVPDGELVVSGLGTEANTLLEANIKEAVGIVAGTSDDANNLSIIMTARDLKPKLITVARQNNRLNTSVFKAAKIDMIMDPGSVIANHIFSLIKAPQMIAFLEEIRGQSEEWCEQLSHELDELVGDRELDSWTVTINEKTAPAFHDRLARGDEIPVSALYHHPLDRAARLPCRVLMVKREGKSLLTPEEDFVIRIEDKLLLCGKRGAGYWMYWALENRQVLRYILHGEERSSGYIWRRLKQLNQKQGEA
ncbi:MAG: NAD-binding protein [Ketobacteraceae bacterium]|nr:NAD-binding protein [Ketobacteraceae bacterium]